MLPATDVLLKPPGSDHRYAAWRAGRLEVLPPAEAAVSFLGFCGSLVGDAFTNITNGAVC